MSLLSSHVLLMPEDTNGLLTPAYGVVSSVSGSTASVRLLSPPNTTLSVPRSLMSQRVVGNAEFGAGAPGEWLRKPVVGIAEGNYVYGQVVEYQPPRARISTAHGEAESLIEDLIEIAPVLCFLKSSTSTPSAYLTADELTEQHHTILDRLMGENGQNATRSIQRLLRGFISPRSQPKATDTLDWINASTGTSSSVRVRHAIDFAYYVDGNRRVPASMRNSIGTHFDDDPAHRPPHTTPALATGGNEHGSQPNTDTIDAGGTDLDAILNSIDAAVPDSNAQSAARSDSPTAPSTASHARVLAAISNDPDLVRFYLEMCSSGSNKRHAGTADERDPQRQRLRGPSDLIDAGVADRRPKHAFAPTQTQMHINGLLVAPTHAGKTAIVLVDAMISSRAAKFQPHPAIIARIYAFEFGARGLTIMHFRRFDFAARRAWYADGSVNLNNFAASVALPKAARPRSLDDLSNALTVLHVFVEEFFDTHTSRLVSAAREFVEDLRSFSHWSAQDVATLAFWFDRVFEDYRTAAVTDARSGTMSRLDVQLKMSLRDPELQSILYIIQSERLSSLRPSAEQRGSSDVVPRVESGRRVEAHRQSRKTPRDVLDALPRKGRLSICMKYLSAGGCTSKSDERCAYPGHAHFLPAELAPVVRDHITNQLGGLRPDLR